MMIMRRMATLLNLVLVGLLVLLSNTSRAQKNTLHLWVDTVYIDTARTDVLLDVKFKLDVQRPPVQFYAYVAEIDFGPSAYVRVLGGTSGVITQNTASRLIPDPYITVTDNSVRVVAFGSPNAPVDTSYSTLFRIRLTAFAPGDGSGMPQGGQADFIWDPFEFQMVDDSNVDEIVYGSGWIRRLTSAPVPTFDTVKISSPAVTVVDDSTFDIPVIFEEMSKSKIKHFAYSFDFDSSVLRFDDAILAPDISAILTKNSQPTHADVFVQSKDDGLLSGADTLFYLRFTSKKRTDTLCTSLQQVGFVPVNTEAKIDSKVITTGEICVQGAPEEPKEVVEEYIRLRGLTISPNPASEVVSILLPEPEGRFFVSVYDIAGRTAFSGSGIGKVEWKPGFASRGIYYVIVTIDGISVTRQLIIE
jgi:hypothetical protein